MKEGSMELGELEKRLKTLEDKDAIKELHREYVFLLIMQRWNEMVECFTDDATAKIASQPPCKGKKEIRTLLTEVIAKHVPKDEGHLVTQPVISVDGDKAEGHWLLYVFLPKPVGWRQARYDCEYARVKGQWKISSLVFQAPWPPGAPA
jgi:ketosteroid isomerase-like protein